MGGEEGIPRKPKPGRRSKPPLLRPLVPYHPIDRFWNSEVERDGEELRTKPLFRWRLVERCKSVELSWTEVGEAETKSIRYDTVEPQSPSYVYAKRNRTHSLDLFVDAKKIPRGLVDVVCRDLKQAHADGKITADIPKKKRGRKRKRKAPLPPRQLSSSPDSGREWEPFRGSHLVESSSSSDRDTDSTTSYASDSSSGSSNSKRSSEKSSVASSRDSSPERSDKGKAKKPNFKPKPKRQSSESGESREPSTERSPKSPIGPAPQPTKTPNPTKSDSDDQGIDMATNTTQDLVDALTKTLKDINQSPTIPMPVFKGKKGEDPEDHILKVEDYFAIHSIEDESEKVKRFKNTLFEIARKWVDTLDMNKVNKWDSQKPKDKDRALKQLFLQRFAKEGRTLESAYDAWRSLSFDPAKDDIEQFIARVKNLAKKLGYNSDAQVMAVKSVLPRDVYGICMTQKDLGELEKFLVHLFSNPKMREAVPGMTAPTSDPSVFSIGQHVDNRVVGASAADIDKIRQHMNTMQVRFDNMSSADTRDKQLKKPWKPEVTPPRRRGGFNRGRGGRRNDNSRRGDQSKDNGSHNYGSTRQSVDQKSRNSYFRGRGQNRGSFRGQFRGKGRGRGSFDKSPNIRRPRVASKTVDKDKMRCHYCNEPGHFVRECLKKSRDEQEAQRFGGLNSEYYDDSYEESYDENYDDEYEDEVFASLNG